MKVKFALSERELLIFVIVIFLMTSKKDLAEILLSLLTSIH